MLVFRLRIIYDTIDRMYLLWRSRSSDESERSRVAIRRMRAAPRSNIPTDRLTSRLASISFISPPILLCLLRAFGRVSRLSLIMMSEDGSKSELVSEKGRGELHCEDGTGDLDTEYAAGPSKGI